jgi:hypothetical protein
LKLARFGLVPTGNSEFVGERLPIFNISGGFFEDETQNIQVTLVLVY